jgi:fimbrial isopeptide formation D2 family protein/LPXTG-motif cell wall-anchored protein
MKKGKFFKRMGALFLSAVLTLVPFAPVLAVDNNSPDPAAAGSITVHKYLRSIESSTIGTSLPLTETEEATLGEVGVGIAFTLYKVNANYEVTNTTTVADALANAAQVSRQVTDSDGIIKWTFPSNATGYYVLVEDPATTPAGYAPAANSIIALPYAVDDDEWNYDIHVYPKNVSDKGLVKTAVDEKLGYSVGDLIEWNYAAKIDLSKLYTNDKNDDGTTGDEAYGTYKITDVLDNRLKYDNTTGLSMTGLGGSSDVTLTQAAGDFSVTASTDSSGVETVVWTLTEAGIDKLVAASSTGLSLTFKTEVTDEAYGESATTEVKNGGLLEWENYFDEGESGYENGGYDIPDEEKPSVTLYGIEIMKTNNDGSKLLDGAVFKIAKSKADAVNSNFIQYDSDGDGTPDTDVTVTTGAHPTDAAITGGWALFAGLPVNVDSDTTFWLVEDVAPTTADGKYVRPGDPIEVKLLNHSADETLAAVTIINYLPSDSDIPDKWKLPLTGGMGTVIFYVIGAVVMIGAVFMLIRSKKTKSAH